MPSLLFENIEIKEIKRAKTRATKRMEKSKEHFTTIAVVAVAVDVALAVLQVAAVQIAAVGDGVV